MIILGIETSCDETSVGIVENGTKVLALSTLSSLKLHARSGGIIPEVAAREQVKAMIPALNQTLDNFLAGDAQKGSRRMDIKSTAGNRSGRTRESSFVQRIDAVAVTVGPGLIGSLLVGVETARTLAYLWNKPLIPVNHLLGHVYSVWLEGSSLPSPLPRIQTPFISLIVSGGHTDLLYFENENKYQWLGGTLDDAAGECLDKVGRLLGFPYPAGAAIDQEAVKVGNTDKYSLPRPLINANNYDFSFSGLKTAAAVMYEKNPNIELDKPNYISSLQEAIIDVLIKKCVKAAVDFKCPNIVVGGGVSANSRLRERLQKEFNGNVYFPAPHLSGDNGAMIASAAHFLGQEKPWKEIKANPSLYFD